MKASEIKVGMKVRPTKKTNGIYKVLEESLEWNKAKDKGHDWLYVSGFDEYANCWVLSHKRYDKFVDGDPNGDFFNASDFKKYTKEK